MMTTLRQQAVQLVKQVPEEQVPNIIQYIHSLIGKVEFDRSLETDPSVSPKMKAFLELEEMVEPVPELDYEKELEDARNEKYGYSSRPHKYNRHNS